MFILASQSPQRKEILERIGIPFTIISSPFDESSIPECDPIKRALLLAGGKADAVSGDYPKSWVIGCDTLVVTHNGILLEKPLDAADARRMLALQSGKISTVHSALCLQKGSEKHVDVSTAFVSFKKLSKAMMQWWIETGLWHGRSGAFQIDGVGQRLVQNLEGEFETVVGFPVELFRKMCVVDVK